MSESDNPRPEPAKGRYNVLGVIAQGDTGVVYRAMDNTLGWEVAVKTLDARFGPGSAAGRQFIDAARIMGQLQHPAIPAVHDMGALSAGRSSSCG
jgi:serine/threonine protein kinase